MPCKGVGVVLGGLRKFASFADVFLRRRLLVQVEISNKDRAYPWLLAWMSEQNQINQRGTGSLLSRTHRLSVATTVEQHQNGSSSVFFNLIAGTGMHWIKYRDVWMQVFFSFRFDLESGTCSLSGIILHRPCGSVIRVQRRLSLR